MKTIPVAAGLAMALALADPAQAADPVPGANSPCPILRPMAKCPPEGRRSEVASPGASPHHIA